MATNLVSSRLTDLHIYKDLLVPHQRAVRKPLPDWVQEIKAGFQYWRNKAHTGVARSAIGLMGCFNGAALIEIHFGRKQQAKKLCLDALAWVGAADQNSDGAESYKSAFQPFINLSRIDRIDGSWSDALSKLQCVEDALRGRSITMHSLVLSSEILDSLVKDDKFACTMTNTCLIDRFKTLLRAGMFTDIFPAASRHQADISLQQISAEVEIVALCCVGDCEAALNASRKWMSISSPNRIVFPFRNSETLAACGDTREAYKALLKLKNIFIRSESLLGSEASASLARLILLLQTTKLLVYLNALSDVVELARVGYTFAALLDDVLLKCEFLQILQNAGLKTLDGEDISEIQNEIRTTSWYGAAHPGAWYAEKENARRAVDELSHLLQTFAETAVRAGM